MEIPETKFKYHVCLSFAGEDRRYVHEVAKQLRLFNLSVFYDGFEENKLWGKDLATHLDQIYRKESKYCVIFASEYYVKKLWTNLERKSALARAFGDRGNEYILPAHFDNTEIPGIPPTIGYISLKNLSAIELANKIKAKVLSEDYEIIPKLNQNLFVKYKSLTPLLALTLIFSILFVLNKNNSPTVKTIDKNDTEISSNNSLDKSDSSNNATTVKADTAGQYNRYKSIINTINELLPNSTKAYEITNNIIYSHENCDVVEQAMKINKIMGSSLKSLVAKIYEDKILVNESNFNIRPINDLILEIDQWDEDYNQLVNKHKSPCKMPMFAPMQYQMLRGDLIELKGELNQRLNSKQI